MKVAIEELSKVEIITKSYKEGSQAVKWTCDGSPEFTIEDAKKAERGTDIILHIDDDCKDDDNVYESSQHAFQSFPARRAASFLTSSPGSFVETSS